MKAMIADLFCGAGGAAMGLHRAGFTVVGFDSEHLGHELMNVLDV
jgi:site-specific DNA-cytosine methylase